MKIHVGGKNIVAVDFDGTITEIVGNGYHVGYTLKLRRHCKEVLLDLHRNGVRLILWTCRTGVALEEAILFLKEEGLFHVFSSVNDHLPEVIEEWLLKGCELSRKVYADVYIDDHNQTQELDWHAIEDQLWKKWGRY